LATIADRLLEARMCLSLLQALLQDIRGKRFRFLHLEAGEEFLGICVPTALSLFEDRFNFVEVFGLLVDGGSIREYARSVGQSANVDVA